MQSTLDFRTNRDLFSNHYLTEHLPETEQWQEVPDEDVESVYENVRELWESEQNLVSGYNEASLQNNFIDPVLEELGITFEIEETVERNARRPDYAFFADADARTAAFEHRDEGGDFYEEAIAVADAKRWGRKLDTRGEGERDFENPSYQIHVYLQETPAQWAVLTNGRKWRLYYGPTSHRLDSYYEINLPTLLEQGGVEEFRYFYLFFRRDAFVEDSGGDCFLDDVYDESNTFAEALGEDLQDNIYDAIGVLAEGFLEYNDDLGEDDLDLIHDSSLIYLYRLIFVLYAESEGRELLPTDNDIYSESYSLNELKQTVAENLDDSQEHYYSFQTDLADNLDELYDLINKGSKSRDIDPDLLSIPAYNGGLFRTDPDEDDSDEANFLASHEVDDEHLAEVIDLLTRRNAENGAGKVFTDYSSLDIRHLGSIYEGLLEYQLNIAEEPLTLDDGEYSTAEESDEVIVEAGDVYMTTDSGERKATGSYYTPEYVVEYIVENTLGPLVSDIREDLMARSARGDRGFAEEFAQEVFDLKILDPAMGSGHFLTNAVDYLAREIINAQERQAEQQGVESIDQSHDINWARRQVAQRCIYGVDLNPLATELAKVSLWLRTLAAKQPLAFLDHHLKTGNSLVGSDIEDVLENGSGEDEVEAGQLTLVESFDRTRRRALDHVTDRFQALLAIDNETLADVKEMEGVFDEVREDPLYRHLLAMANVHTADAFGLDVPSDAYEQMAAALRDDSWDEVESQDWFRSAQAMAADERFLHWELEFPVAFYGEDGERDEDAGFDAVIGNPPYIRIQNIPQESLIAYLSKEFQTTHQNYDLAVPFTEKMYELLSLNGKFGYIETSKWIQGEYGEKLRKFLTQQRCVSTLVDFGDQQVFEGASTYTVLLFLEKSEKDYFRYVHIGELDRTITQLKRISKADLIQERDLYSYQEAFENFGDDPWVFALPEERAILYKLDTHRTLGDITDEIFQGIITGADPLYILELEEANEKTIKGYSKEIDEVIELERDIVKPLLRGKDMTKWSVTECAHRVIFPYTTNPKKGEYSLIDEGVMKEMYPQTWDYLSQNRDRLVARSGVGEETWWQYGRPQNLDKFETKKVMTQVLAAESSFCIDKDGSYVFVGGGNAGGYGIVLSPNIEIGHEALLAILNSNLLEWTLQKESSQFRGGYYSYARRYIEKLPICVDELSASSPEKTGEEDTIEETLVSFIETILDAVQQLRNLNLAILDYLGNYTEGPDLPDVGLFQPTSINLLDANTEEHEKLRIGEVLTDRDGSSVTIYATARYKPEDEDEHETDRWGYTETDYLEAFTIADLSETEATLVEAFVPVAVEEDDGFAGFRDNATKTTSLVDRLKSITLPDPDDVEDDLRRYVETKERAEDLDEKIEQTDQLIDEIVYELYGLTDEEIKIVEQSLQGT